METNNNNFLNDFDTPYWKEPDRHALCKERKNGIEFYSMFQVEPVLMMKLCDDFEYASRLSKKMIENGVRVFDNYDEFDKWYKSKHNL
jgi:hypothetical protein